MIAKSDPGHYGELETFQMPSNNLPPSPTLVASTMTSDPQVAGLQTLLGVRGGGSEVLFGNLIVVPLEQSLLYVRPVYVQTTGENNPPLLRKVIVLYQNQVQVADTLPQALQQFPAFSDLPVQNPVAANAADAAHEPREPDPTHASSDAVADAVAAASARRIHGGGRGAETEPARLQHLRPEAAAGPAAGHTGPGATGRPGAHDHDDGPRRRLCIGARGRSHRCWSATGPLVGCSPSPRGGAVW